MAKNKEQGNDDGMSGACHIGFHSRENPIDVFRLQYEDGSDNKLKTHTWYKLDNNGDFAEVE